MILEIDAGNTRIKWRMLGKSGVTLQRGAATESVELDGVSGVPAKIRIVSVRGEAFSEHFRRLFLAKWNVIPEFCVATANCANVINGYTEPEKLGVDRWLAVLSAYNDCRKACCVIDAGSAITMDFTTAGGRHFGGFIVPGLSMQRQTLLAGTRIELAEAASWYEVGSGVTTAAAIHNGILSMVVDWLVREVANPDERPDNIVYLTGGDAEILSEQLRRRGVLHNLVPDLVLDGLKFALP